MEEQLKQAYFSLSAWKCTNGHLKIPLGGLCQLTEVTGINLSIAGTACMFWFGVKCIFLVYVKK